MPPSRFRLINKFRAYRQRLSRQQADTASSVDTTLVPQMHSVSNSYAAAVGAVAGMASGVVVGRPGSGGNSSNDTNASFALLIFIAVASLVMILLHLTACYNRIGNGCIGTRGLLLPNTTNGRLASVWELNAVRNFGYFAAVVCCGVGALALSSSSTLSSYAPLTIAIIGASFAGIAILFTALSFALPTLLNNKYTTTNSPAALPLSNADELVAWEALLDDAESLIVTMAANGRLLSQYRGHHLHHHINDDEKSTSAPSPLLYTHFLSLLRSDGRYSTRRCRSMRQLISVLTSVEEVIHIGCYTPNFFAARLLWCERCQRVARRPITNAGIEEARDVLQSLRNGCIMPSV